VNGGVIPHHQQTAYDRGLEDGSAQGWHDGYREGRRVSVWSTAIISFSIGLLAGVSYWAFYAWWFS
jgi:hypothetical protein